MYTIRYMWPVWGPRFYYVYAVLAFLTFSFVENSQAISVMSFVGFFLLALNAAGIWRLRCSISFAVAPDQSEPVPVAEVSV